MLAAADLAVDHQFGMWDAEGFTWRGVTVTNPFAPVRHPLRAALLGEAAGP
jgi:hypothetical protein